MNRLRKNLSIRPPTAKRAVEATEHLASGAAHAVGSMGREPFWQAQAALVAAVVLYLSLPGKFIVGPGWLEPALELALVGGLWLDRPRHNRAEALRERRIVLVLLGMVAASNLLSLELLVHYLLRGGKAGGHQLILSAVVIWLTNVAVFALWYWQLDRGGPDRRARGDEDRPDFLFVQMSEPSLAPGWIPSFLDYLYTSFTNATAFSPTDTMPLTVRVKMLMLVQSMVSLITIGLVAARAVNVLA